MCVCVSVCKQAWLCVHVREDMRVCECVCQNCNQERRTPDTHLLFLLPFIAVDLALELHGLLLPPSLLALGLRCEPHALLSTHPLIVFVSRSRERGTVCHSDNAHTDHFHIHLLSNLYTYL